MKNDCFKCEWMNENILMYSINWKRTCYAEGFLIELLDFSLRIRFIIDVLV